MKKNITVVIIVALGISLLFNLIAFTRLSSYEWVKEVKSIYYENEEKLNHFTEICLVNEISSINMIEHSSIAPLNRKIDQYYVYSFQELTNEDALQLKEMFELFEDYKINNIWCDIGGLLLGVGDVSLHYKTGELSIEQIKEDYFYDEVRYLDENWFIGIGDSVM